MNISLGDDAWKVKMVIVKNKPAYRAQRTVRPFVDRDGNKFFYGDTHEEAIAKGESELKKLEIKELSKKEKLLFNNANEIISYIEKLNKHDPICAKELIICFIEKYKAYRTADYASYMFYRRCSVRDLEKDNIGLCELMRKDIENNDFALAYFIKRNKKNIETFEINSYQRQEIRLMFLC